MPLLYRSSRSSSTSGASRRHNFRNAPVGAISTRAWCVRWIRIRSASDRYAWSRTSIALAIEGRCTSTAKAKRAESVLCPGKDGPQLRDVLVPDKPSGSDYGTFSEAVEPRGVALETIDDSGYACHVARGDQHAADVGLDKLRVRSAFERDRDGPGGHALEQRQAERLVHPRRASNRGL